MGADLIADFCGYHHEYNSISAGRRSDQIRVLRRLEASLGAKPIASLSADDLRAFVVSECVAPATTLKHLKMIRTFLHWLWERKVISGDQLMELRGVRAPRGAGWSPPKPYTRHEIACFWEHFEYQFPFTGDKDPTQRTTYRAEFFVRRFQRGDSKWGRVWPYARRLQAEAIIALALYGGLRRNEIFNLELEDMHYENAYIRVMGAAKNPGAESLERAVPMTGQMRTALANWMEFRAQILQPEHDRPWLCLWREDYLEPMTLSVLAHMLDKVGDGYTLHRMRHTYATERLRAGMPVEVLQKALGHHNIQQTLRYAKIGAEDVINSAEKTNDAFEEAVTRSHT